MSASPRAWWIAVAHAVGGGLVGVLEAARLGALHLVLVLVPVCAATGLLVGAACVAAELAVARRLWPVDAAPGAAPPVRSWWARPVAALALAAPSLVVTLPVCATLFDGAYAQTLPLAGALPYLTPLALWLAAAIAVGVGRHLAAGDLTSRAIAILATAGGIGAIAWLQRKLGTGYLDAHAGATIATITLVGAVIRLARRVRLARHVGPAIASVVVGGAVAAALLGLGREDDRRLVAERAGMARDVVRVWRGVLDLDRDGSSALLGGGDCDDRDPDRHPGALDTPGDGIDQDCDGEDAPVLAPDAPVASAPDRAAWRAQPAVAELLARTRDMNLVLITVDALRLDLLAPGAPDRGDFPRLVALLDHAVFFTRAFSAGSGTDLALSTLLTSRLDPYQPTDTTLVEAIHGLGRTTSTVMPGEVLRHVGEALLDRGVDHVRTVHTDWAKPDVGDHVSASATTDEAIRAIAEAGDHPFFVWAHYFDVHEHHQITPPPELLAEVKPGPSAVAHTYRAMLRSVDQGIGRLLDDLDARGLADRTIVVFASDHGESLKEDPRLLDTHGRVLYAPLIRIPVALRVPGVAGGVRTDPVSLADLAPTLLELFGAPDAMAPVEGVSLVPALLDAPAALRASPDRPLVLHEELQWSVVQWPHQLLVRPADDVVELYDLDHDPAQRDDLAARNPELVRRLKARYAMAPAVRVDRSPSGRAWRQRQALRPPHRARP